MEILGDKEYVTKDSFLLDASITRKEILAPLPPFDPTGLPSKYSQGVIDREQEQAGIREGREGFFIISFAAEEITSLLELLLKTAYTSPG